MPKFWGKQIFSLGSFHQVGQKQKTEKKERKKERLNDGNNNGQATQGARKHALRTQAACAKKLFIYLHIPSIYDKIWRGGSLPSATTGGTRKPPGPKK